MNDTATAKRFSVVSNEIPDPPYPSDTRANGYGFDLDVSRMQNSDSWVLCPPDVRPWMLMAWVISWAQRPCGSLPSDDEMIAARLGCSLEFLQVHRRFILRDWVRHSDDRLYHPAVTEEVTKMIESREKWKAKKKGRRTEKQEDSANVPGDTQGNTEGVPGGSPPSPSLSLSPSRKDMGTNVPMSESPSGDSDRRVAGENQQCPHRDIIALYHTMLPELSAIAVSRWAESKDSKSLQARWREDQRHQSLDFWERFFQTVRTNPHWMGQGPSGWSANLRWLVKRENFSKVIDRMVDNARREREQGVRRG